MSRSAQENNRAANEATLCSDKELSECDRQQLHLLGHIQGRAGHALFVSYPEGTIIAADAKVRFVPWIKDRTENGAMKTKDIMARPVSPRSATHPLTPIKIAKTDEEETREMLGTKLASWIPSKLHGDIWEAIDGLIDAKGTRTFHFFSHREKSYAITMHTITEDYSCLGIEIELLDRRETNSDFYSSLISLGRVMEFNNDEKVLKTTCDSVFKILGKFDRGMVYKFNDDNSGEIVYEVKKDAPPTTSSTSAAPSYLGMRFPAADIPLPARQLYIQNGLRYIEDVSAEDIPIVHVGEGQTCNLAQCRMRAVAKPHIMYLRNMGVVSSMSIAIVVENRLWGLLAFHGYNTPFKPSLHQRIACETINSMLSVKMEAIVKKSESARVIELSETLARWKTELRLSDNLQQNGQGILTVLDADVLVARIQDPTREEMETVAIGNKQLAPGEKFWKAFEQQPNQKLFSYTTRKESAELGLTEIDSPAAGVVYLRDSLVQVMAGRGLRSSDVVWGGDPNEPKERVNGLLCPRKSFDKFMEKARNESRAWSTADLRVIGAFMDRIVECSIMRMMTNLKRDMEEANLKYLDAYERIRDNSSWFAHMSHEIRTPFHGVMGCLNILQDSGNRMPKEEIQDMVDTALQSGNHMMQLLNDILDIAKNKYLSHSTNYIRTNYQTLASEATQGLRSLAYANSIEFHSEVLPKNENSVIITDKTKVVQVVSNLLNNAIKFSEGGRVEVQFQFLDSRRRSIQEWGHVANGYEGTIFTMQEHEVFSSVETVKETVLRRTEPKRQGFGQKKWLLIAVKDSGCGMKPGELAEMLRPYTQSSNGSNRVFQGTGLGLFICTSLCRQLGGFIACSSTPNNGTVFHVGIPVDVPNDQAGDSLDSLPASPVPSKKIKISGPVAVCDDNKVNVKILQRSLQSEFKKRNLDIEVLTAFGGQEIVDLFKERKPALLFIDYHMPEVDGIEATERIRRFEMENGLAPSYIMSYTADATDSAERNILSRGSDEIMTKPPPKGFIPSIVDRIVIDGFDRLHVGSPQRTTR